MEFHDTHYFKHQYYNVIVIYISTYFFDVLQSLGVTWVHHVDWMSHYVMTRMQTVIVEYASVDPDSLRKMAYAVSYIISLSF